MQRCSDLVKVDVTFISHYQFNFPLANCLVQQGGQLWAVVGPVAVKTLQFPVLYYRYLIILRNE